MGQMGQAGHPGQAGYLCGLSRAKTLHDEAEPSSQTKELFMQPNQPPDLRNLVSNIHDTLRATLDAAKSRPSDDSDYESGHTRTGKVARLPAPIRETVNIMLHEGVP